MIIIGNFCLHDAGNGKIGIYINNDGEGGEFSEAELAEVIEKFYKEKF